MKVSGFTFVKNAMALGYPLIESISSLLPLCDEIIIAAGKSEDDTLSVLKSLESPKIHIYNTVWDNNLRQDGRIYSEQTNIALSYCSGDWCIYLQADEVLHENDYNIILEEMELAENNPKVEALLFKYKHFYGNYNYLGVGRQWYRREIRAFKNTSNIVSWGDAQGFRKKSMHGVEKLHAKQTEARIFHYGWVRHPKEQEKKLLKMHSYYHQEIPEFDINQEVKEFSYNSAYELAPYNGEHPAVMKEKIERDSEWTNRFNPNQLLSKPFRIKLSDYIERISGYRIWEYKDFIEIK